MAKRRVVASIGTAIIGSLAIVACVADGPSVTSTQSAARGELGGPCFENDTCAGNLVCSKTDGSAKCVTASGQTSGDASIDEPPPGDGGSGEPQVCRFEPTPFPCGDQQPPTACYGSTQYCTATLCNGGDVPWDCNSARQCGTPCCVSTDVVTHVPGLGCSQGTLIVKEGSANGARCSSDATCAPATVQLCQANSDCPTGQRCGPVKVVGGGASFAGAILGACIH